jgi:PP-loop superfamily ATP-utilizing enzyme
MARRFVEALKALGFTYVTLDLEGYRQGSLNAQVVRIAK